MSNVGFLRATHEHDELKELKGTLKTLTLSYDLRIVANDPSDNPNYPSHTVFVRNDKQEYVPAGAAWTRTITRGENTGDEFLSITLDDPSFDAPMNVAAFKSKDGRWEITWRRRQVLLANDNT